MKLRSATAIALAFGLATFSLNAVADTNAPKSPGVGQLPGNTGVEGSAGGVARDQNEIDKRDHSGKGNTEVTEDADRLPGNVGTEGSGAAVGEPKESGYNTSAGATGGASAEKKLPGNVGGEGSGKTQ